MTSRRKDEQTDELKNVKTESSAAAKPKKRTTRTASKKTASEPKVDPDGADDAAPENVDPQTDDGSQVIGDPHFAEYRERDALVLAAEDEIDIPVEYFLNEDFLDENMNVYPNDYEDATEFDDSFDLDFQALDDGEFDETVDNFDGAEAGEGEEALAAEVNDDGPDDLDGERDEFEDEFDSMNTDENTFISDEENDGRF